MKTQANQAALFKNADNIRDKDKLLEELKGDIHLDSRSTAALTDILHLG
jgi:hypothetical protein